MLLQEKSNLFLQKACHTDMKSRNPGYLSLRSFLLAADFIYLATFLPRVD